VLLKVNNVCTVCWLFKRLKRENISLRQLLQLYSYSENRF